MPKRFRGPQSAVFLSSLIKEILAATVFRQAFTILPLIDLARRNILLYTRCSITPCSAISQASCQSPDDRRGAALLQEDVGGHVGVNHTQKVSRKGGNGDQSGQMPSGSGDPLRRFSRRRFCDAVWVRLRVLFFK